jgi:hypothetical protein
VAEDRDKWLAVLTFPLAEELIFSGRRNELREEENINIEDNETA